LVNPSDPLVVQGFCLTCAWNNENLTFKWDLYFISDKNDFGVDPKCVFPVIEPTFDDHVKTTVGTIRKTSKDAATQWPSFRQVTAMSTHFVSGRTPTVLHNSNRPTGKLVTNQKFRVEKGNICSGPITANPTVPPTTNCKYVTRKPSYGRGSRFGLNPTGYWLCSSTKAPFCK
jgi:hypothetical protein